MHHLTFEEGGGGGVWKNWIVQDYFFSLASGADNFLGLKGFA